MKRLGDSGPYARPPAVHSQGPAAPHVNNAASGTHSSAPVLLIRDVAYEVGVGQQPASEALSRAQNLSLDIIDRGLISTQEAFNMIEMFVSLPLRLSRLTHFRFHEHYGRWVVFNPVMSPEHLLGEVRKSPLLLCACCLIAVRHTAPELAPNLAPQLFQEAKARLSSSLLEVPQSIEFFQAVLVLCMWSTTIGQTPMSIDSWLVSGFALQHSLASDVFAPLTSPPRSTSLGKRELDHWCLWNHICLVHLQ